MRSGFKNIFTNVIYSISVQIIYLLVAAFSIIVVPKILDVDSYGYWQLYLFYIGFVGFFHFGLIDGIYLRYGGFDYNDLNKGVLKAQFWILLLFESFVSLSLIIATLFLFDKEDPKFVILISFALNIFLVVLQTFFLYILQTTNRIKDYSKISIFSRLSFLVLLLIVIFFRVNDFNLFILTDLISKLITLIVTIYICFDLFDRNKIDVRIFIKETKQDFSSGLKLMISNITGILILGIIRFFIEQNWDIATFGKISLSLNVSQVFLILVSALSIVIFPILKRYSNDKLSSVYTSLKYLLILFLLFSLVFYFPIRHVLGLWLPDFDDKLNYLVLLFPIIIFESKMSLLISPYLKAMRKESILLKINIISLIVSIAFCLLFIYYMSNLNLAVLSILLVFAFRSIIAEIYISRLLSINFMRISFFEWSITIVFILLGLYFNLFLGGILFFISVLFFCLVTYRDLKYSLTFFKKQIWI